MPSCAGCIPASSCKMISMPTPQHTAITITVLPLQSCPCIGQYDMNGPLHCLLLSSGIEAHPMGPRAPRSQAQVRPPFSSLPLLLHQTLSNCAHIRVEIAERLKAGPIRYTSQGQVLSSDGNAQLCTDLTTIGAKIQGIVNIEPWDW